MFSCHKTCYLHQRDHRQKAFGKCAFEFLTLVTDVLIHHVRLRVNLITTLMIKQRWMTDTCTKCKSKCSIFLFVKLQGFGTLSKCSLRAVHNLNSLYDSSERYITLDV